MGKIVLNAIACLLLLIGVGCTNKSDGNLIPVQDFFAIPEKTNFKISPDGKQIAYLGLENHCKNIFILNLEDKSKSKQLTYQADMNVQYFFWANKDKIVYSNTQSPEDSLRLFAIDVHTEAAVPLFKPLKRRLRWVNPIVLKDNSLLAAINERDSSVFDIYRVFLDGRPKQLLDKNPGNVISWYGSPDGEVRLALTSDSVEESILYRPNQKTPFKEIVTNDFETNILPLGFVKGSSSRIYALSNVGRDKLTLVEYDASSGTEIKEIFGHPDVDLNSTGYSNELNEMVYAGFALNKETRVFFNEKVKQVNDRIKTKVDQAEIEFIDRDSSLNHFIFKSYTDQNPGAIYYYNAAEDKLMKLADLNPKIANRQMSAMEPMTYQTRDGLTIQGYITYPLHKDRKNLPVVVIPHDGPNGRVDWGFQPEVQFLASRGYVVFQMNYRGSVGYGKKFWVSGFKEWGGKIQNDITDGVMLLIHEGIADRNKIAIMGNGFGGYSALYAACFNSSLYACAVSNSGYTNLFTYFKQVPPYFKPYVQFYYQVVGNPETESDLFKAISPVFHSDKVKIPIFMVQGGRDKFSSVNDANQFVQRLKNNNVPVQYIVKDDEGRRFKNEENIVSYYQELEVFLNKYLK